ncbi:MAG: YdcF family protein [Oscillospiraceae bacterium]|nr:YdcF family protein [Oscillospiraceae bacterium]
MGTHREQTKLKRPGRVWRAVCIVLLAGLLSSAGVIGWVVYAETHLPPVRPSDVIIVLGAQVKADGSLSLALARRLTKAVTAYQQQPQLIIVCGAQGENEPAPEGQVMRDWLIARGIPEEDVAAETSSFNTRENLMYARALMAQRGLAQALVVTSDYHVARALALCKQLGIAATGAGSASEPAYWIKNHVREGLSWVKFWAETLLGQN